MDKLIIAGAVILSSFISTPKLIQDHLDIKTYEPIKAIELKEYAPKAQISVSTPPPIETKVSGGCEGIRAKLADLGVSGAELDAAIKLAMRESTCNEYARNATSSACGAFQSLPCGKWGPMGSTEYYKNAISYCKQRYSSFQQALAFQLSHGWY